MIRKIIHIDEEKCNGCGACSRACHEGAIDIINGKAKLMREHFCDGLGDCLPNCPMGAITFENREAPAYDEAAVHAAKMKKGEATPHQCPGTVSRHIVRENVENTVQPIEAEVPSLLGNWPVQIKLAPLQAPYYDGAKLLVAADCTAYAYASFQKRFIKNRVTLIGCPKLDAVDYSEKLGEIIAGNDIKEVTIVRMEVPCCGGLEMATRKAIQASGKFIPWQVVTINIKGGIIDE